MVTYITEVQCQLVALLLKLPGKLENFILENPMFK